MSTPREDLLDEARNTVSKNPEGGRTFAPLFCLLDPQGRTRGILEATDEGDIVLHVVNEEHEEVDLVYLWDSRKGKRK